ncbi:hypothetical protein [Nonomuraea rhodomycinica]|uniref:Uncharacterized protein n=1 Tax=Nonomuraea rhodomycinica TaxID=1712872 RepID=A0A7Y6MG65_9ACTN|nr:hypothetical protein [Nonomuraea rhodomycinica]NUW45574.1 hypothetical protein [Nonomuraea rhodomycinica]
MTSDDLMRAAGAAWCDQHGKWECSKQSKRSQSRCHGLAIRGTAACRTHAGVSTAVAKAKGEALSAWRAVPGRQDVSPAEAVMAMLQMSWARVHIYAGLLEQQLAEADPSRGVGYGEGLVGHTFSASPSVGVYESGEAVRGLAKLEAEERDRCVRYARVAHDMGIADREIRLAEAQGALLAGAISRILDALDLTAAQRSLVPTVVPGILLEVAGGAS